MLNQTHQAKTKSTEQLILSEQHPMALQILVQLLRQKGIAGVLWVLCPSSKGRGA